MLFLKNRYCTLSRTCLCKPIKQYPKRLRRNTCQVATLVVSRTIIAARGLGRVWRRSLGEPTALVRTRRGLVAVCARSRGGVETGSRSVESAVARRSAAAGLVSRCATSTGVPGRLLSKTSVYVVCVFWQGISTYAAAPRAARAAVGSATAIASAATVARLASICCGTTKATCTSI